MRARTDVAGRHLVEVDHRSTSAGSITPRPPARARSPMPSAPAPAGPGARTKPPPGRRCSHPKPRSGSPRSDAAATPSSVGEVERGRALGGPGPDLLAEPGGEPIELRRTELVALGTDVGSDPRLDGAGRRAPPHARTAAGFDHAGVDSPPSRVHRADHALGRPHEHHRHAGSAVWIASTRPGSAGDPGRRRRRAGHLGRRSPRVTTTSTPAPWTWRSQATGPISQPAGAPCAGRAGLGVDGEIALGRHWWWCRRGRPRKDP